MLRTALPLALAGCVLLTAPAQGQTGPTVSSTPPPGSPGAAPAPGTPRVLHLDEAVQTALRQQPQLLEARANAGAAEGRVTQARSPLFPQISGTAALQRTHTGASGLPVGTGTTVGGVGTTTGSTVTTTGPTGGARDSTTLNFGVTGNQLLWDFGQTWYNFRASERSADSLRASAQATALGVVLNVRTAYFQARATRALVRVAQETLDNQIKHQQQVEGFVRVGTRPEIDLAQQRTNVANARVQLINAQNNDRIALATLNQAMGVPGGADYEVADEEMPPLTFENAALPSLFDEAVSARPEVASFEYARQSREALLASVRGGWGPTLSFGGSFSENKTWFHARGSPSDLYPSWAFGLNLNWPLFQGGLTVGRVREAEQNLVSAASALDVQKLQVRFDVEQADATLLGNRESVVAAKDAVESAREQLRLAEGRYQAGIGTIIELSDAQVALTNASGQLVQAQFNLSTARARLVAALGRQE